jgi:hypothetical protein
VVALRKVDEAVVSDPSFLSGHTLYQFDSKEEIGHEDWVIPVSWFVGALR